MRKKMVVCTFGLFAILLLPAAADEGLSSPPRRLNAVGEGMPSPPRRLNEFKVKYVFTNLIPIGHVHLRLIIASRDAAKTTQILEGHTRTDDYHSPLPHE
jgi:hypothetical protein